MSSCGASFVTKGVVARFSRLLLVVLFASGLQLVPVVSASANALEEACVVGGALSCEAYSPQELYNLYGTTSDGAYFVRLDSSSVAEQFLLMNRTNTDNGAWILLMKGRQQSTGFAYSTDTFTSSTTTFNTTSLSNDFESDAKFDSYNKTIITKILAAFKDPERPGTGAYAFPTSGTGDIPGNPWGAHVWLTSLTGTPTAQSRLNSEFGLDSFGRTIAGNDVATTPPPSTFTRYSFYYETNTVSSPNTPNSKQIFSYQVGWGRYGFNISPCTSTSMRVRWGFVWNNENDNSSCDVVFGIGTDLGSGTGDFTGWSSLPTGPIRDAGLGSNSTRGKTAFQLWGKTPDPSLGTPTALSVTGSNGTATLSWTKPSGTIREYLVQYKLSSAATWDSVTSTVRRVTSPTTSPTISISGLQNSSYDFRVFARGLPNNSSTTPAEATLIFDDESNSITHCPTTTITSLSPSGGTSSGGIRLTITGSGLTSSVYINGHIADVRLSSSNSVTLLTPAGTKGAATVRIDGCNTSSSTTYLYDPDPVISSLSTISIATSGGAITITGSFLSGASITIGTTRAAISSNTDALITASLPPSTAGEKVMTLTTPFGSTTSKLTYLEPPSLAASISSGYIAQGDAVNLSYAATGSTSYSASGILPHGLSFNTSTGALSGIATKEGIYNFSITASNAAGSDTKNYTLDIDRPTPRPITTNLYFSHKNSTLSSSNKVSLDRFITRINSVAPRNLSATITMAGGAGNSKTSLTNIRHEQIKRYLEASGIKVKSATSAIGSASKVEVAVTWTRL